MANHVSRDDVRSLKRAKLPSSEMRTLVGHLIAGCTVCQEPLLERYTSADYDQAFLPIADLEQRRDAIARQNLRGIADWSYLEPRAQGQRLMLISNRQRFQHLGLYNRLLDLGRQATWEHPERGLDLAHLAVALAHRLSESEYGPTRVADFKAAAHAARGNAYRLNSDYTASRAEFIEGWQYLQQGTGDPLEEYNLLSLSASLQAHLGFFEQAYLLLARAIRKARSVGDPIAEARALVQQGEAVGHIDPTKAIPLLQRALELLGANDDWCRLCARHNLAWFLNDAGRSSEAIRLLDATRPLYERFPHTLPSLVLHWLEGRIAHKMGDLHIAEEILRKVWDDFHAAGFDHHLPIVSVDLAEILADRGEAGEALHLLTDTYTVMCSWQMKLEALATMVSVCDSVRDRVAPDAATVAVFSEARLRFRRGFASDKDDVES